VSLSRRQFALSAASLFPAGFRARAQDRETIFSASVKVVNVYATVRKKSGEIVRDLTKDDFSLTENGRPQTIGYFSRESGLPLTIGLAVDTSGSQEGVLDAELGASLRFLDQVLREDQDKVFVIQFDFTVVMRQPLTASRKALKEGLSHVNLPDFRQLALQRGGGTVLYDAIVAASRDVMNGQTDRKALIVLTDGVDTGSDATIEEAIAAAQRADTLVYSILFSDDQAYGFEYSGGPDGRTVLERISRETGGGYFEVSKKQGIDRLFTLMQDQLRSQYSLGFVSNQPVRSPEFRKLKLTTRQKGLIVETRDQYWARR
jgi:VWFA-related protein